MKIPGLIVSCTLLLIMTSCNNAADTGKSAGNDSAAVIKKDTATIRVDTTAKLRKMDTAVLRGVKTPDPSGPQ